jgi:hypothetical protein
MTAQHDISHIPQPDLFVDWRDWVRAFSQDRETGNALTDQALIAPLLGTIKPLLSRQIVLEFLNESTLRISVRTPGGTAKHVDLTLST